VADTLMYLGATCFLARDSACTQRAFARYHRQFGELEPDASVLNPETQVAFARSREQHVRTVRRGQLAITGAHPLAEVTLDGRVVDARAVLDADEGEHWLRVAVPGLLPFVTTMQVRAGALLNIAVPASTVNADAQSLAAALAQAGSPEQGRALARRLDVDALALVRVTSAGAGRLTLSLAHGSELLTRVAEPGLRSRSRAVHALLAEFIERSLVRPVAPLADTARSQPQPVLAAPTRADATPSQLGVKPWYRRAWVWTLVGVAVASGATATVLLVRRDSEQSAPEPGGSLTLEF
jgi:hypothetical protein